jgi:hypothetical protein
MHLGKKVCAAACWLAVLTPLATGCGDSGAAAPADGGLVADSGAADAAPADAGASDAPPTDATAAPDAQPIQPVWSAGYGGPDTDGILDVETDTAGNVFVGMYFEGTVDVGTGAITSYGARDQLILSYTPDGQLRWVRQVGSTGQEWYVHLAVDEAGDVLLTGDSQYSIDLGGGPVGGGAFNTMWVAKLAGANGAHLWSRAYTSNTRLEPGPIAVDASGDAYLAGNLDGTFDFGGGPVSTTGNPPCFFLKLSGADGAYRWVAVPSPSGSATNIHALAVTPTGTVLAAGDFDRDVAFGSSTVHSAGYSDVLLVALDASSGSFESAWGFGGPSYEWGANVAVDTQGGWVLTGNYEKSIDFGGGPLTTTTGLAGDTDAFLARFDATGHHLWSRSFGGVGDDNIAEARFVAGDELVVAGRFGGATADFGGGDFPTSTNAADFFTDVVVAHYAGSGAHLSSASFGGSKGEAAFALAVWEPMRRAIVVGAMGSPTDFGAGPLPFSGMSDAFLASLAY